MSSGVSLYYPYIHITNDAWLKRSLLYWDKVRRIVPEGLPTADSEDSRLAAEQELLLPTPPKQYLPEAAQRFRIKIPALLEEITRRGESLVVEDPAAAARDKDIRIYVEKMDYGLRNFLLREQIVQLQGDWIVSHPDIADWYMTCLATVMSEKIGSPVVTNFRKDNAIGEYLTHANPASGETSRDLGRAMLRLRVPFPDTDTIAKVPFEEILEFREKYAGERRNLRDSLEDLMKDVPTITDKNDLCDHLHDKQARLDKAIEDHRKAADRFYVKTIPSVLQISIPTGPMALAAALHAPPLTLAVLGTGAVALLALAWWAKFKDDEAAVQSKPYQYLLTLEEHFGILAES